MTPLAIALREFWRWRASVHILRLMNALEKSGDAPAVTYDLDSLVRTLRRRQQTDDHRRRAGVS